MKLVRPFLSASAMAMIVAAIGCTQAPRESAVINGSVVYLGKPLADAEIHLLPKSDVDLATHTATTDSGGRFVIKTEGIDDRPVAPGIYVATITKYVSKANDAMSGTNIVPAKYTDRTKTPLVVEVKMGVNDLAPFDLKND